MQMRCVGYAVNEFEINFTTLPEVMAFGQAFRENETVRGAVFKTDADLALEDVWVAIAPDAASGLSVTLEEAEKTEELLGVFSRRTAKVVGRVSTEPDMSRIHTLRTAQGKIAARLAHEIAVYLSENVVVDADVLARQCVAYYLRQDVTLS